MLGLRSIASRPLASFPAAAIPGVINLPVSAIVLTDFPPVVSSGARVDVPLSTITISDVVFEINARRRRVKQSIIES